MPDTQGLNICCLTYTRQKSPQHWNLYTEVEIREVCVLSLVMFFWQMVRARESNSTSRTRQITSQNMCRPLSLVKKVKKFKKKKKQLGIVVHAYNTSTQETKARGSWVASQGYRERPCLKKLGIKIKKEARKKRSTLHIKVSKAWFESHFFSLLTPVLSWPNH
jgi:hypothetical protein